MNRREIYFLCNNNEKYICLEYQNNKCKHCKRLKEYNLLFDKIRSKKVLIYQKESVKLFNLVERCADFILKYKRYYILPELKDKACDLNH